MTRRLRLNSGWCSPTQPVSRTVRVRTEDLWGERATWAELGGDQPAGTAADLRHDE
jgi:hypothetical protein